MSLNRNINQKRYVKKHRQRVRDRMRKWRRAHSDQVKSWAIKQIHGITLEDHSKMLNKQNGNCAICEIPQSNLSTRLCVDHNHKTGALRGLLCKPCNLMLGNAKDSIEILERGIEYLKAWNV